MKRPRPLALDYLIYVVIRLVVCVAQALTIRQSYRLADALGALLHRLDRRHREIAHDNLRQAYGDALDDAARDRIVRGVYRHFCRMLMEMLHIPRKLHPVTWRRHIRLVGHEVVVDRLLKDGPMILLSGHFGNWEMVGYLFGVFGFPPHSVARVLDNPFLDRYLRSFRERTGQKLIPKKGGYDELNDILRKGGVVGLLADQDAGPRGLFVDFFGRPASTHKAIALLAIEYNARVVVGGARRVEGDFRYQLVMEDLIEPEEWADVRDPVRFITERFTSGLERMVRQAPEQYLWLHRRWKNQPKPRAKKPHVTVSAPAPDEALSAT